MRAFLLNPIVRMMHANAITKSNKTPPLRPLIAIIGATGTGKSQLAVEIASRFNGEIINGDAMQLYDGLPIITNKIPVAERKDIPHHLLGRIGLSEPTWTVGEFVRQASKTIDDVRGRGRLPVLVGGTHYYTQALLFEQHVLDSGEPLSVHIAQTLEQPTEVLLQKLRDVDPVMADRWHPNDRRKIQRSLEIYLKTGKTASETYDAQQSQRTRSPSSDTSDAEPSDQLAPTSLRHPTLIFWVYSARDPLHARLDTRVEKMLSEGLLDEVAELDSYLLAQEAKGNVIDRTRGIWVSIGYKEFEEYQTALRLDPDTGPTQLEALKQAGLAATQAATRRYSNSQSRWIRIKLLNALKQASALSSLYLLDASDISQYTSSAIETAIKITRQWLEGEALPDPTSLSTAAAEMLAAPKAEDISYRRDLWARRTCDVCDVTAVTERDWLVHVNSNRHKKVLAARRKKETNLKWKLAAAESAAK